MKARWVKASAAIAGVGFVGCVAFSAVPGIGAHFGAEGRAREAAQAGAVAVRGLQVNPSTAERAYRAAVAKTDMTQAVDPATFRLNQDHTVTLTWVEDAGNPWAAGLPGMGWLRRTEATVTQGPGALS